MKKFSFLFLFALLFAFVLVGCGEKEDAEYTVAFTGTIGTTIESQTVKENECATKPTDPTRADYVFEGWFLGNDEYDFTTPVTADITLTAKWAQLFDVKFVDGETVISEVEVKSGDKVSKPETDPTKADNVFAGWYVGETAYDFNAAVTSDLVIAAKWDEVQKFTVQFYGGIAGDVLISEQQVLPGEDAVAPEASKITEVPGYEFKKWSADFTNVQSDLKITAKYEEILYEVTFYLFGEQYGDVYYVSYGEALEAPLEEYREGYEFKGWDKSLELLEVTQNLEVHAIYEAVEYTVKYYMGDVELTNLAGVYTIETEEALPTVEYTGCEFVGWYTDPTFAEEAVTTLKGSTGDKVLYSKFTGEFALLVDPAVATLEAGSEYELDGNKYIVGQSVVATIAEAAAAGAPGAKLNITVLAGTYADDVVITKNDTTILGPNAEVDPTGADARNAEAIITGKVTLNADLDNVTIQGFKFAGNAQVISPKGSLTGAAATPAKNHENFVFKYNVVNVEVALEETGSGFMVFIEGSSCYSSNTQIVNNVFEMNGTPNVNNLIYMDNNEDLKLKDNIFRNIPVDAFYVHDTTKGCSGTDVQITGNTFDNIGGSAIWLNWVSPTYGTSNGKFVIEENTFSNVGTKEGDWAIYFGSINNGDFIEVFSVSNNTFADCTSFIYIHRTHSNGQAVVDGSVFLTAPEYVYVQCPNTSTTADIKTKVLVTNSTFHKVYSTSQFVGDVELGEGNEYTSAVVVNAAWADKAADEEVEYNGETYVFGTNAYASLAEAASKEYAEGAVILVAAGTYEEDFTISSNGVSIVGAGYAVAGAGERPAEESVINAVITLAADVDDVTIQGFKFVGKSQIIGVASSERYNHENLVISNNVVEVELTAEDNGFIVLKANAASYDNNTKVVNNLFVGDATLAKNLVWTDNVENIKVNNNVFRNVKGNAIFVNDTERGLSGATAQFNNNTFDNVEGSAIWINWFAPGSVNYEIGEYYFDGNTFNTVKGYAINIVKCNNSDALKVLSISNNTFTGELTTAVKVGRINKAINYVVEGNTFETVPSVAYFDGTNSSSLPGEMKVYNNVYKQDGEVIMALDATKFIGDVDYKKPEAKVTYVLAQFSSKEEVLDELFTDFYNWLVSKEYLDATAITLEAFIGKENDIAYSGLWFDYVGSTLTPNEAWTQVSTYAYFSPANQDGSITSETRDDEFFLLSNEYGNKWAAFGDWINFWAPASNRFWTSSYGKLELARYATGLWTGTTGYKDANLYIEELSFSNVHNAENHEIAVVEKAGYTVTWNTKADGTGETISELSATEFVDLTLYAIYTPVVAE